MLSSSDLGGAMTKPPPTVERASAGLQYVIPGTERYVRPRPVGYPGDGAQLVIPAAERISDGELLRRGMAQKLLPPRRRQRPAQTTPLFRATTTTRIGTPASNCRTMLLPRSAFIVTSFGSRPAAAAVRLKARE
jgi:hypothetical protein